MRKETMQRFYEAFQRHDAAAMGSLYHKEAQFNDPVFQNLNQSEAQAMWSMLVERSGGHLEIEFHSLICDEETAQCTWGARYQFSKTKREVHNVIHATMKFRDGLIIEHTDHFNFWRWSKMALGTSGLLLGWTPFLRGKVRKMALSSLKSYMKKHST